jgi:hypothetical protein
MTTRRVTFRENKRFWLFELILILIVVEVSYVLLPFALPVAFIVFILLSLVIVIIHEFLHALGWWFLGGVKWREIEINLLSWPPHVHCKKKVLLSDWQKMAVLPSLPGFALIILFLIFPENIILLPTSLLFIFMSDKDLIIFYKSLKEDPQRRVRDLTDKGFELLD